MAFNIWERWPWTSFQNLNLDWLMKAVKEAVTKSEEASESVGQFDARITANTNAIEQLGIDLETISSPAHVLVSSELEARYRGNLVTGAQLLAMMQTHGDLPYVEYNGEVYALDTVSNAGDLRFSMGHTVDTFNELVIRHIMIPAQSYNAAYSITNVSSGGGGSSDVFTVIITDQGEYANPQYIFDSTFSTIRTQMAAGNTPVFLIKTLASGGDGYNACGNVVATTSYIDVYDPLTGTTIGKWRIYPDNTISRFNAIVQLATLDNIIQFVNDGVTTNALLKTAQTLSAAEQAQVKQNLGITSGESSGMTQIPITSSGGVFSTTMTATELLNHLQTNGCFAVVNGVYYVPVGGSYSGPNGNIYLQSVDQSSATKTDVNVMQLHMDSNSSPTVTVTLYEKDVLLLPATTNASADDFLMLDSNKNPAWVAVPNAANVSFGGV